MEISMKLKKEDITNLSSDLTNNVETKAVMIN